MFTERLASMAGSGSSVSVFLVADSNLILHCAVPHRRLRCAIMSWFHKYADIYLLATVVIALLAYLFMHDVRILVTDPLLANVRLVSRNS